MRCEQEEGWKFPQDEPEEGLDFKGEGDHYIYPPVQTTCAKRRAQL